MSETAHTPGRPGEHIGDHEAAELLAIERDKLLEQNAELLEALRDIASAAAAGNSRASICAVAQTAIAKATK